MPELIAAVLTDAGGAHLDGYFTGLAEIEQVGAVVVSDPSGESEPLAKKLLGKKLVRFDRDHNQALSQNHPGLAVVTLEAKKAPPVIAAALDANCHVLAEKPACIRAEDFEPLVRLADMKHRHLMLALANRTRNTVQAARKLIQSGQFGKIYGCELHTIADQTRLKSPTYHKAWFADRDRAGGGHLMWLGIHWIDLVMFLTGSQIIDAAGFTGIVGGQPLKSEDSAALALRFDNATFGTITSGYYLDRGKQLYVKIWGANGWLQLEFEANPVLRWYKNQDSPPQIRKYEGPIDDATYTPFIRACVQSAADSNVPPPITSAESLRALKTVFTCYRAAETGQTQHVG